MVSATSSTPAVNNPITLFSGTTSAASATSFAQQLAATLEQYLSGSNESGVQINIQREASQNSDSGSCSGQYLVTATTPQAASSTASSPNAATAGSTTSSSASGGDSTDDYVTIPFGNSTTTVPTLAKELANEAAYGAMMSPAAILHQDAFTQAGDPMSGVTVPGTNMKWDDLTQDQQLAYLYAMDYGMPSGQTMQDYLTANVGAEAMWNAPYSDPTMFGNS